MTDFVKMRTLIKQEERYRWAVERQNAKATKVTTTLSKAGRTGRGETGSQMEENTVILAELKEQHREILDELEGMRGELRGSMKRIRSQRQRLEKTILRMRYLQGISIRKIAAALSYSEDYMFQKMKDAETLIINIQTNQEQQKNKTVHLG